MTQPQSKLPSETRTRSAFNLNQEVLTRTIVIPVLAVFTALMISAIIIRFSGGDPILAYIGLWEGAFGSPKAISETLVWSTPYIFAGLSVAIAFKGGLFNIGAEGQLSFGALASAWIGFALPQIIGGPLPWIVHLPLAALGGIVAGAIWGAIPGWLKARTGAHEVINTIMMNYIAVLITSFLLNGVLKDPNPFNVTARTPMIAESARITPLLADYRVHWGTILAFLVAFGIWWFLWKTTLGFEIRTVGANPNAAKYAGINVSRIMVITMGIAGGLAGAAGMIEVTALNYRQELGFSVGYGFDALAVALLGRNHPLGVVLSAVLFGAMRSGATRMQFLTQIPVDIISVVQALILLLVAAEEITRYIYRIKASKETVVLTRGWGG